MTHEERLSDYPTAIRSLSRRRTAFWAVFLGAIVALPAFWQAFSRPLQVIAFILWVAWLFASGFFLVTYACPRCGETAFFKPWYQNVFARKCLHCKLPLD